MTSWKSVTISCFGIQPLRNTPIRFGDSTQEVVDEEQKPNEGDFRGYLARSEKPGLKGR